MNSPDENIDRPGLASAGSQLQLQLYVNRRSHQLSEAILDALPTSAPFRRSFLGVGRSDHDEVTASPVPSCRVGGLRKNSIQHVAAPRGNWKGVVRSFCARLDAALVWRDSGVADVNAST